MNEVEMLLRKLKKEKGILQGFIASKLEVTESYLSKCKNNKEKPSQELLDKLRELAK